MWLTDFETAGSPDAEGHRDDGAVLTASGLRVQRPWGSLAFAPLTLKAGWYEWTVAEGNPSLCLTLKTPETFKLIELSAESGRPAYVRLQAGRYVPQLFGGPRPGLYTVSGAALRPLSAAKRLALLGGRLAQALRTGIGPTRLLSWVRQALNPQATFGLRAAGRDTPDALGALTRQDVMATADIEDMMVRVAGLKHLPHFYVRRPDRDLTPDEAEAAGLNQQGYHNYSLTPEPACDVTLFVDEGERLTPDALLLFAETLSRQPEIDVVMGDVWVEGRPTLRVAFDPVLYSEAYPTPYALRIGAPPFVSAGAWQTQQARHALIGVPVAKSPISATRVSPSAPAPEARPKVSVIIPTRDAAALLSNCLKGLFEATDWPHEVIVVDNGSVEAETFALFEAFKAKGLKVVRADIPFNFSTLCNLGAEAADADYLAFVNNDVAFMDADWLSHMMAYAVLPDVGAVGARLYYADERLQHAGVALGLTEVCGHPWRGLERDAQTDEPRLTQASLRSAVTGAMLLVAREKFETVGGFDAENLPVTLNDVDLCLRLKARGWYSVLAAEAEAWHLEGETRGEDTDPIKKARRLKELHYFSKRWASEIANDPWLPPAMMRSTETFGLK